MNLCKYAQPTNSPWSLNKPEGVKTFRCYYPDGYKSWVASGLSRVATIDDTFDIKKPSKDQIIQDADYVCVRSCCCNRSRCKYYQKREE